MDGAKTKTEHQPLDRYGIQLLDPDYDPFSDFMALGDGYMDAKWRSDDLGQTLYDLCLSRDIVRLVKDKSRPDSIDHVDPEYVNLVHYDEHERVIREMIGRSKIYTGADWRSPPFTLEYAQQNKVYRINEKIELKAGMRLLDLGCGWGGYAGLTKLQRDVHVTGVTLSPESAREAERHCDSVFVGDYAAAAHLGKFDRVVSMGLLEHVGIKNLRHYMKTVSRHLKDGGVSLIQTIGYNTSGGGIAHPWVDKYIFPNGELPSMAQIAEAMEGLFVLEDVENLGIQYAYTIDAWYENFASAVRSGALRVHPRFYRMWEFFLMFFRAAFLTREYQLWHVVMSKKRLEQAARV